MARKIKDKKFQLRIGEDDYRKLMKLASMDEISMAAWITNQIRLQAKRRKLR